MKKSEIANLKPHSQATGNELSGTCFREDSKKYKHLGDFIYLELTHVDGQPNFEIKTGEDK